MRIKALGIIISAVLAMGLMGCGSGTPAASGSPAASAGSAAGQTASGSRAGGGNRGGGGTDKSSDKDLQKMISEVAPKFELRTFKDADSGESLQYQFFVPKDYDSSKKYPLVQFIPDSSVVGKEASNVLSQGWGGLIWATEEEQAKNPAFVVVPVFTETIVDDSFNHSAQIDIAVRLINSLTKEYSIDTNRLYTTGQSMGGMTSFYINLAYPDMFAASLFVGSQWDNTKLSAIEKNKFFYIVSAGDPKASAGQSGLMEVFDNDKAPYSHEEWSAQDDAAAQDAAITKMLGEGNKANFVTFTAGTTIANGSNAPAGMGEHMTSFDYAYKIGAVRDWLFKQSK